LLEVLLKLRREKTQRNVQDHKTEMFEGTRKMGFLWSRKKGAINGFPNSVASTRDPIIVELNGGD